MMSHVKKTGSTSRYPPLGGSRSPSPTLGPNHVTPYDPPEPPNFNRSLPTPRMALFDGNNPFMNRGQLPTTIRPSSTMYSARQSFGAARSTFVGPSSPANEGNDGDGNGNASSSRAIGMARPVHPDRNLKSLPNAVEVAIESYGPHINLDSALCRKVLDGPALRIPIQRRKDRHLNTARRSNGEALLAYITGTAAPRPCKSCSKGYGPWKECIIFEGQLYGSCANCWFNASGARCTFHDSRTHRPTRDYEYDPELLAAASTPGLSFNSATTLSSPNLSNLGLPSGQEALPSMANPHTQSGELQSNTAIKDRNICLLEYTSQALSNSIDNVTCLPTEERYVARVEVALEELNERLKEWAEFVGLRNTMIRSKNPNLPSYEMTHAHPGAMQPRQRIRVTRVRDAENAVDPQILQTATVYKSEPSPVASSTNSPDSSMASVESSAAQDHDAENDGDEEGDAPMV